MPALAAPATSQESVDRAVAKLEAARRRSALVDARLKRASAELERVISGQQRARERLNSRALMMYRSGDTTFISLLLGAATFEQFAARWDLLTRMGKQDAKDLRQLETARAKASRSAESLMQLQVEEARAVDEIAGELARARKELAASRAALREYGEKTSSSADRVAEPDKADSPQQQRGSGAWETGVASHYGRSFTGRGADGREIGPYSMIVAHKTLPFGTLIEFEYGGKRAVARVADRGPHTAGRLFDLGPGVVRILDFSGVHEVRYRIIQR